MVGSRWRKSDDSASRHLSDRPGKWTPIGVGPQLMDHVTGVGLTGHSFKGHVAISQDAEMEEVARDHLPPGYPKCCPVALQILIEDLPQ